MADVRESFPVLEDAVSGAGLPLHKVLEGDAAAAKNALAALVGKDGAGNLKYLKTNTDGELIVNLEDDTACLTDEGSHAGDNAAFQDLASIALAASTDYSRLGYILSCFRDAIFEILWIDDDGGVGETEHLLATVRVGPGHFTDAEQLDCIKFASGAVGTQTLKVRGKNLNVASTMNGTLSILEAA